MADRAADLTVVESFSRGRDGAPGGGDDVILISPDYVGVFDGVTSRSRLSYGGVPGGRFAAETAAAALRDAPGDLAPLEQVAAAQQALRAALERLGTPPAPGLEGPATTMCVLSRATRSIVVVGGARIRVDGADLSVPGPPSDRVLIEARELYLSELLASGATADELARDDPSAALLAPLFQNQWHLRNRSPEEPWTYGVIDGTHTPEGHVTVVPLPSACEVVLATDGYRTPAATLAEAEADVAARNVADPLGLRVRPGVMARRADSQPDDRAYLRVRVS